MKILSFFPLFLVVMLLVPSCKKDELLKDSNAKLEFSTDSIIFDTVFTTVGSTTKQFKFYNKHKQKINISHIYLATGASSPFRINVDGVSGKSLNDVEILAEDSLFVFVQVTVNPLNSNSPMLIADQVIFETNGNVQEVQLVAVGQDVYLHKPNLPTSNPFYSIINCNDIWTNDKPHLIFGYAVVDSGCKLTMMPGTRVHLNKEAVLWVYKAGTLEIKGNYENEVRIEGARLEPEYKEIAGQWGKIWLSQQSKNNVIDWAIIKNGGIGVQVDTVATVGIPTLKISNTIIKNMQAAALFGQGAHIRANNCVFSNCGKYVAALTIGGKYRFEQCTFANYWSGEQRNTPVLALNNYYISGNTYVIRNLDSAYFKNCILDGNLAEEIGMDSSIYGGNFRYKFDHCLIKTERNTNKIAYYNTILKNVSPDFKDAAANNYQLNKTSIAIDKGDVSSYFTDLNNKFRPNPSTSIPDLGAYEFYP